jgi:hypothetical protein
VRGPLSPDVHRIGGRLSIPSGEGRLEEAREDQFALDLQWPSFAIAVSSHL